MSRVGSRTLAAAAMTVAAIGGMMFAGAGAASASGNISLPSITLDCQVQAATEVNLHVRPDINSPIGATVSAGTTLTVVGTVIGTDGRIWLRLDNGLYVRADLTVDVNCGLDL